MLPLRVTRTSSRSSARREYLCSPSASTVPLFAPLDLLNSSHAASPLLDISSYSALPSRRTVPSPFAPRSYSASIFGGFPPGKSSFLLTRASTTAYLPVLLSMPMFTSFRSSMTHPPARISMPSLDTSTSPNLLRRSASSCLRARFPLLGMRSTYGCFSTMDGFPFSSSATPTTSYFVLSPNSSLCLRTFSSSDPRTVSGRRYL